MERLEWTKLHPHFGEAEGVLLTGKKAGGCHGEAPRPGTGAVEEDTGTVSKNTGAEEIVALPRKRAENRCQGNERCVTKAAASLHVGSRLLYSEGFVLGFS